MAVLDNAIWLTGTGGTAVSGTTQITDGPASTTVTGTFTGNAWDATAGGSNVSDFGAFGVTSPITAQYDFSTSVENLSFSINHVNDDGASTYDDKWTIEVYDENGDLIPAATVIAGLGNLNDENVTTNPDGTVSIEAAGTIANDVTLNLAGPVSQIQMTYEPGSGGTQTGGSGLSDLTFDIPAGDRDGDGVADDVDIDADGDGILNEDEGMTTPTTITITFEGDQYSGDENTWELYDASGTLIASGNPASSTIETTNIAVTDLGEYRFVVNDSYGDGMEAGSFQIEIDGTSVYDSGTAPNFGSQFEHNFDVVATYDDTDGDGIANYLDLDSDNDGITDNVEAQTTQGYIAPTGTDSDGDGLDDAYEGTGNQGLTPVDSDGTGGADFIDTDADGDGISDAVEAGHGVSQATIDSSGDADGDGIKDAVDDVAGWDVNDADVDGAGNFTLADSDDDIAADGSDANGKKRDLDYRDTVPCFTPGAMVETPHGPRAIETLRAGDMVLTRDSGPQPVRWIGQRTVLGAGQFAPVRFLPNSLEGLSQSLIVSPNHRLLINNYNASLLFGADEVFVAAKQLVNGSDICWANQTSVTYIHLMFDQHEVITANGAETESFHAGWVGLASLTDQSRDSLFSVFPDLRVDPGAFGNTARLCLKDHEARVLSNTSVVGHSLELVA